MIMIHPSLKKFGKGRADGGLASMIQKLGWGPLCEGVVSTIFLSASSSSSFATSYIPRSPLLVASPPSTSRLLNDAFAHHHSRLFSSSAASANAPTNGTGRNSDNNSNSDSTNDGKNDKKTDGNSNIFLDNLGKIFLAAIASVIVTLVRSSYNTVNRSKIRNRLEQDAILDPAEIDDLRVANSELTPDIFRVVMDETNRTFSTGMATYEEFVKVVRMAMARLKGEAFTVELGHLMDRVVVNILEHQQLAPTTAMPTSLWLTVLSLALNSDTKDRIRILYEILEKERDPLDESDLGVDQAAAVTTTTTTTRHTGDEATPCVTFGQVEAMVQYLQESCQLPADTQIVPTDTKFPTQQFARGRPQDLVPWEGSRQDAIDLRTFASILRSKSVCAWGECYHKKNFDLEEV